MDPDTPPARSRWSLCAEAGWLSPSAGRSMSGRNRSPLCRRLQARPADSRRTAAQGKPTLPFVSSTSWGSRAAYWVALICRGTAGASLPVGADCMGCESGSCCNPRDPGRPQAREVRFDSIRPHPFASRGRPLSPPFLGRFAAKTAAASAPGGYRVPEERPRERQHQEQQRQRAGREQKPVS